MISYSTHADVMITRKFPKGVGATFVVVTAEPVKVTADLQSLPDGVREAVELLTAGVSLGKVAEVASGVAKLGKEIHRVFTVGVGKAEKVTPEELRKVGGAIFRVARRSKLGEVAVLLPSTQTAEAAEAVTTGILLASWEYTEFAGSRKAKDLAAKKDVRVQLVTENAEAKAGVERATAIALSTNFARTVASRPGNVINPVTLAEVAKSLAKETGLKFSVLDEKQMAKLSMGGLLGVGSGSETPPRLIALEHKPAKAKNAGKPLLIVGKSITFDTGGISIKPAERMQRMIYDKSGGMAVLGLMHALANLKTPVHVVGLLTSAENHVSSKAYRPGDILKMYNGITVEITNTDAEGRLVLGDAIAWGIETYKPSAVVDLATLTGGVVVALGTTMAGLFSNDNALATEITAAGLAAGEKMWRLPVGDDQRDMLKSDLADVINSAGRHASPLTGAAFVSLFVPPDNSVPWVHLDIAGVADTEKELGYMSKGSTGWGVRTLVNWVESKGK